MKANNGITSLIDACNSGRLDVIEVLLSYGAKTNIRTNNVRLFKFCFLSEDDLNISFIGLYSCRLFDVI